MDTLGFLGVRLHTDERAWLEQLARLEGRSLASMVRRLIALEAARRGLARRGKKGDAVAV